MNQVKLAVPVTPNDSVNLSRITAGIYVGVAGNVTAILAESPTPVTFTGMPVGFHDVAVQRVLATGTTATNILAIY